MRKDFSKSEYSFAQKIISEINSGLINTDKELEVRRFFWSKELKLNNMPPYPFILSQAVNATKKVQKLLSIKPTRSLSGVQVIAVMLPPFPCPGKCTYCPSSLEDKSSPKSYTGFEPSALRAQRLDYDSYKIVENRIKQLDLTGNFANKIEIIFQGSSFTSLPKKKQEQIVKNSLDAVIGKKSKNILEAKAKAEKAKRKVVGITFETRPDLCTKSDVKGMLSLGGTRVEIGVQNPSDKIYSIINRGHTVQDVVDSTKRLKDSSFKVLYHLMPGLPGSDYKTDLNNFREVFTNPSFKPDMVKFYPCLVIKGTKLYDEWQKGNFEPMGEEKAAKLLAQIKSEIPKWVRVMRVNRDIPSTVISAGVMKTNLRQLVEEELHKMDKKCNCIRCREIGLQNRGKKFPENEIPSLSTEHYSASEGEEAFISFESKTALYGFARLRKPASPFLKEITPRTALIRELHVYGKALPVGENDELSVQHKGLGQELILEAERIAKEKYGANKMVIISGLGVKDYYKKYLGYKKDGDFMSKKLK
ncbi:MAG: tRNA uridine(34) 5-carboxymethylaminomethyl modification radical SAM/GNAT enzyme Elp3 [archaeon]|jgi:elongator complex protein 3